MSKRKHHGMTGTLTYQSWRAMIQRTKDDPNSRTFRHYYGRGIIVCDRWRDFRNFFQDMGNRPTRQHTIGRKDNDKGYHPENCEWQTKRKQQNERRGVRKFDATQLINAITGQTHTLRQIAHLALAGLRKLPRSGPDASTPEDTIAAFMVWLEKNKRTYTGSQLSKVTSIGSRRKDKLLMIPVPPNRRRQASSWDDQNDEEWQETVATLVRIVKANRPPSARSKRRRRPDQRV
jgi:hypothetical protein